MSPKKKVDKYAELQTSLEALPHISPAQVEQWVGLQKNIDQTRDFLIRAVPPSPTKYRPGAKDFGATHLHVGLLRGNWCW